MSSVVLELQRDALDRAVPLSDLLRKALVVAKKLGISEFETWIAQELNGYQKLEDVPDYRKLNGLVKAWNPYRGWVPVIFQDPVVAEAVSERHTGQSVAAMEELLVGKGSIIGIPFPHDTALKLAAACGHPPTEIILEVHRPGIRGILDSIRTIVLNWALKLEQDGILGEGLAFTKEERDTASRVSHNVNNFFGPVGQSQIQQGAGSGSQVIVAGDVDPTALRRFLALLGRQLPKLNLDAARTSEVEADVRTIESQVQSPKPKATVVRACLASIKSVLEGAAGNVAGQLLIELAKVLL
jgi:hypothetical protein